MNVRLRTAAKYFEGFTRNYGLSWIMDVKNSIIRVFKQPVSHGQSDVASQFLKNLAFVAPVPVIMFLMKRISELWGSASQEIIGDTHV